MCALSVWVASSRPGGSFFMCRQVDASCHHLGIICHLIRAARLVRYQLAIAFHLTQNKDKVLTTFPRLVHLLYRHTMGPPGPQPHWMPVFCPCQPYLPANADQLFSQTRSFFSYSFFSYTYASFSCISCILSRLWCKVSPYSRSVLRFVCNESTTPTLVLCYISFEMSLMFLFLHSLPFPPQ